MPLKFTVSGCLDQFLINNEMDNANDVARLCHSHV